MESRILFVVYTPYIGFLPKRMKELERKNLDGVRQVVVTPSTYTESLSGLRADTVHLIELTPDNTIDRDLENQWFGNVTKVREMIDLIKTHNI
jgi:hypothetical protein